MKKKILIKFLSLIVGVGMSGGLKAAMKVSPIDTNRRVTVHIDRKQIVWLNDSTFYIQHKPIH